MLLNIYMSVGAIVLGHNCTDLSIILQLGLYSYSIYEIHEFLVFIF